MLRVASLKVHLRPCKGQILRRGDGDDDDGGGVSQRSQLLVLQC